MNPQIFCTQRISTWMGIISAFEGITLIKREYNCITRARGTDIAQNVLLNFLRAKRPYRMESLSTLTCSSLLSGRERRSRFSVRNTRDSEMS